MKIKEEREKLESLLAASSPQINDDVPVPGNMPEELKSEPLMGIDFAELKQVCNNEARVMINNSISFILPSEMILDNEYIKNKLEVDIMSLGGMIYQLRTNEAMQKALMTEVDRGMINPRMFEVFSGLSKTIADINKQLLGTVEAIKSTYKEIKNDIREKQTDALGPHQNVDGVITQVDGGIVTMGTKELINNMKKRPALDTGDVEEVQ
jgi:hypothetical protein